MLVDRYKVLWVNSMTDLVVIQGDTWKSINIRRAESRSNPIQIQSTFQIWIKFFVRSSRIWQSFYDATRHDTVIIADSIKTTWSQIDLEHRVISYHWLSKQSLKWKSVCIVLYNILAENEAKNSSWYFLENLSIPWDSFVHNSLFMASTWRWKTSIYTSKPSEKAFWEMFVSRCIQKWQLNSKVFFFTIRKFKSRFLL